MGFPTSVLLLALAGYMLQTAKFCSLQQAAKGAHGTPCDMQFPPHLPPASTAGQGVVEPRLTGEAQMPAQPCHAQLLIALPCLPHSPPGRLGRLHARPANHVRPPSPPPRTPRRLPSIKVPPKSFSPTAWPISPSHRVSGSAAFGTCLCHDSAPALPSY